MDFFLAETLRLKQYGKDLSIGHSSLPAIFAYRVAEGFNRKVGELVRHQPNLPDVWEDHTIKSKFQSADWKQGEFVEQEAQLNGKEAYRVLIPGYY